MERSIKVGSMIFYHGTTKENYEQILKEGVLWGRRGTFNGREVDRCTYLAIDKEEAMCYGDVLLEVEYEPRKGRGDNYCEGCWQVRVYNPIPISDIKVIEYNMNWLEEKVAYALRYSAPKGFGVNSKVLYPISKRLIKTEGICPCAHDEWNEGTPHEDKLCPCKTFRDTGDCHCGLYVKLHLKE